jgi:hypothetical protein
MDFHVVYVASEMLSYIKKNKEKVNMTVGPEFGVDLHGKNLTIDKSIYGIKTSAARFHKLK